MGVEGQEPPGEVDEREPKVWQGLGQFVHHIGGLQGCASTVRYVCWNYYDSLCNSLCMSRD